MSVESAPRRTQEERSAATRTRLLNATIECLVEHGYAATTVARVAERAGVTRGAQVHHFPTKEDLVIAAVSHLNELRAHAGRARLDAIRLGPGWVDELLDVLWEQHQGAVFVATAEMWVAARTQPALSEHLAEVEEIIDAEVGSGSSNPMLADPEINAAVFTAMDAIRGLAMSSWHLPEAEVAARWKRLKRHLHSVFPQD